MKITFFCRVDKKALSIIEFYNQDIEILKSLGHELNLATKYSEIDWKSDIIFIWWWTYAFYPVFIARLLGKKTIITGTFNYLAPEAASDYFRRPFWQRKLIKYSIKNANQNILVSKHEYRLIKKDWKLENLFYSPHTVDTDLYIPNNSQKATNFIFTLIWTGKLNMERKCLSEIVETAKSVTEKHADLKFFIAGRKGDGFEDANNLIIEANLTNKVILLGEISLEEKIKYLQDCTLYLQPSKYEGFGLAMAEAMSCGAPVITSDVGEVKNVIGDAGILLSGHNIKEITTAVETLLGDINLRAKISKAARKRILNNFAINVRKNDFKNIIENL